MVKLDALFDPQSYLKLVTGNLYFIKSDVVGYIEKVLEANDLCLWNYPLSEIEHIVENDIDVVLVDCSHFVSDEWVTEFRWFEVPSDIESVEE